MKLQAVIGANYGDEGKGLVTDYLCSGPALSLVVRFNGGAQAGHTVVTPETRHVFHHLGSGTLKDADTFLSKFFIVNPFQFFEEFESLYESMSFYPKVFVDPRCIVTTPIDMMLNQAIETARNSKHGSCGLGINETVHRNLQDGRFRITVEDIYSIAHPRTGDVGKLREMLDVIKTQYLPIRMQELGIKELLPNATKNMDAVLDRFMSTVTYFVCNSRMAKFEDVRNLEYGKIVFEGAQGLLLDQDSPDFPHVTRSKTGLHNVASLLDDAGLKEWDLETFYVTRTYLTRHGAGPLPNATRGKPYQGVVDNTNTPNEWQGTLRYGVLDVDALGKRIVADTGSGSFNVVLTCVDQVDNGFLKVSSGGTYSRITVAEFVSTMKSYGAKKVFVSTGPTSSDVSEVGVCEVG